MKFINQSTVGIGMDEMNHTGNYLQVNLIFSNKLKETTIFCLPFSHLNLSIGVSAESVGTILLKWIIYHKFYNIIW